MGRPGRSALAAAGLGLLLAGCNETFEATKGVTSQAHLEFRLWYWMMGAGFIVAIFVWLLIFWSVFRYRRKKGDETIPEQTREHVVLEYTYTLIPLVLVLVIFAFTFVVENKVDNVLTPPSVIVNIKAYQWGWQFEYSEPISGVVVATAPGAAPSALARSYTDTSLYPQLVLPAGETTRFFLRSNDVIHGFYVHDFNFSRYAQPGVVNEFEIKPVQPGVFPGQCTQYCGLYHSEMLFSVRVVTPRQFQTWITAKAAKQRASLKSAAAASA